LAKFIFKEGKHDTYWMDFRLWIEGVDVTKWVTGTVSWSLAGTDSQNQLSFTLANQEDTWILTKQNLCKDTPQSKRWRKTDDLNDERAKKSIWERKDKRNKDGGYDEKLQLWTYPLNPNTSVFHTHDCVRLFVRNPLSRGNYWIPAFTGFIDHHPMSDDYITGTRPLNFTCYCLKGVMKRMRVGTNPIPAASQPTKQALASAKKTVEQFIAKDAVFSDDAGYFSDLYTASGLNHVLAGKNFEQSIYFLLLGETAAVEFPSSKKGSIINNESVVKLKVQGGAAETSIVKRPLSGGDKISDDQVRLRAKRKSEKFIKQWRKNNPSATKEEIETTRKNYESEVRAQIETRPTTEAKPLGYARGQVGRLQKGQVLTYPPESAKEKTLEDWQELVLYGSSRAQMTESEMIQWGKATVSDNLRGSPWAAAVHMLLPKDGTAASTFVQAKFSSGNEFKSGFNFSTRYDLVNETCRPLDYQWYVSPLGDVMFEFPMMDFEPQAFGYFRSVLTGDLHLSDSNIEDEAGEIPTALVVTGQENVAQLQGVRLQGDQRALDLGRLVVYSPVLAKRLGAKVETMSAPTGIGAVSSKNSDALRSQSVKGLEAWANLQFQKRLGQSSTLTCPLPFRIWLTPNRPFLQLVRERMGIIGTVSHSLIITGEATTDLSMLYVRTLGPDLNWRYFSTGGANMPLSYASMFTSTGDQQHSGVVSARPIAPGSGRPPGTRSQKYNQPGAITPEDLKAKVHGVEFSVDQLRSIDPKLPQLRPKFAGLIAETLLALRAAGHQAKIHNAFRSQAQQSKLAAKGRGPSKVGPHNWGLAADIIDRRYAWCGGKKGASRRTCFENAAAFFAALGAVVKSKGLTWGGSWFGRASAFKKWNIGWDPAHVQYRSWSGTPRAWRQEYRPFLHPTILRKRPNKEPSKAQRRNKRPNDCVNCKKLTKR
jgi:hypothetical protein